MKQTQEEFAFCCNISVKTLYLIENAMINDIKLSTLIRISEHAEVDISELIDDDFE